MGETVGKRELLRWASDVSGREIDRFDDIKDGAVLLKLFHAVWPTAVDLQKAKWKPRPKYEWETKAYWDYMKQLFAELKLPMSILDRPGVTAGRFKSCYSLLVMLFFLHNLARNHEFTVRPAGCRTVDGWVLCACLHACLPVHVRGRPVHAWHQPDLFDDGRLTSRTRLISSSLRSCSRLPPLNRCCAVVLCACRSCHRIARIFSKLRRGRHRALQRYAKEAPTTPLRSIHTCTTE